MTSNPNLALDVWLDSRTCRALLQNNNDHAHINIKQKRKFDPCPFLTVKSTHLNI